MSEAHTLTARPLGTPSTTTQNSRVDTHTDERLLRLRPEQVAQPGAGDTRCDLVRQASATQQA